ncbi:hypothetical protein W081_03588, partial [Mycobacterium tuberculosis TB_RSA171]
MPGRFRHYWSVSAFNICRFVGAPMVTTWALLFAPVPAASADPPDPTVSDGACPDVEVVFARGTGEPPGVGGIGVNRPGMSGDSSSWKGWGHVRWFIEEVPAGAA